MLEKPIIFNAEMVRAILDRRKTQTRRPIKPQPPSSEYELATVTDCIRNRKNIGKHFWVLMDDFGEVIDDEQPYFSCRYAVGDVLWVRETWAELGYIEDPNNVMPVHMRLDKQGIERTVVYYEEIPDMCWIDGDGFQEWRKDGSEASHWRPSVHMPRWAARFFLEVTAVRAERLQDISHADAKAEGIECHGSYELRDERLTLHQLAFSHTWDSIYAKRGFGWAANPFVWVFDLKRVEVES